MTEFKKYPSIENHYQTKFIAQGAHILNEKYIVREKLDGANIQIVFTPFQPRKIGKRTSYLETDENFMDIWNTLDKYKEFLSFYQQTADSTGNVFRFYGEIYGRGIQKRIDYGNEKYISIFDLMINDNFLAQSTLESMLEVHGFRNLLPESYGIFDNLVDALKIETKENTEGVVIQPLNLVHFLPSGSRFIIKKKREDFDDKRTPQKIIEENTGISALNLEFRSYINENRVKDVFSKYGEIQEPKQIPDYIKYVLEDAKEDFLKNHNLEEEIPHFEEKMKKDIFNVGGAIVLILKKYL